LQRLPGLSIFAFTDPTIALEHFKINRRFYDLVTSDLRMQVINGFQLLKTVKDLNPQIRTILMTAFDVDDELFAEYRKKEIINSFVQKPIRLENLVQEVSGQLYCYEMLKVGFLDLLNIAFLQSLCVVCIFSLISHQKKKGKVEHRPYTAFSSSWDFETLDLQD
jgi:CheY-like chemotaxis protein